MQYQFRNKNQKEFEIFKFNFGKEIELFSNHNLFEIGIAKRENFELCIPLIGEAVDIKINGKLSYQQKAAHL